ncbi:hypothetical protein VKT23_017883 [Stygiomarasmius scandens]|uniref:TFIIS N-terminal domain-containing protein n=1 Tax=Marasmiellus scandens TaxID=2682957 RepID=A0ABR1ISF1_9AGAR
MFMEIQQVFQLLKGVPKTGVWGTMKTIITTKQDQSTLKLTEVKNLIIDKWMALNPKKVKVDQPKANMAKMSGKLGNTYSGQPPTFNNQKKLPPKGKSPQ